MKIIENSINSYWSEMVECSGCNSKLEIMGSDIRFCRNLHTSIWESSDDWYMDLYYIACPVCKSKCEVEEVYTNSTTNRIPKAIGLAARNK